MNKIIIGLKVIKYKEDFFYHLFFEIIKLYLNSLWAYFEILFNKSHPQVLL